MKKLMILTVIMVFGIFATSCNDDTDGDTNLELEKKPIGNINWTLTNLSGGFVGLDQDYKPGIIEWRFDSRKSILRVINNDPKGTKFDVLKPGEYHYYLVKQKGGTYLFIEEYEFGNLRSKGDGLIIDQNKGISGAYADGYILSFKK